MNTSADPTWSQAEQMDPMTQLTSADLDELDNLFEFGDIDLSNIPDVDANAFHDHVQTTQPPSHAVTSFQDLNIPMSLGASAAHDFATHMQYGIQQQQMEFVPSQRPEYLSRQNSHNQFSPDIYQAVRQPYPNTSQPHQFSYQTQLAYPSANHVPPTPTSFEMHGMQHPQQLDPQQRAILEQRFHIRKDDVTAFTPMVSPAGTPQFNVPSEFTTPGAYFSPLTSPMLHAQANGPSHLQGFYTNPSTNVNSNATSPADLSADIDMLLDEGALPEGGLNNLRRPRRKPATPRSVAVTKPEQSPAQKAQKAQKRKSSAMLAKDTANNADMSVHDAQRLNKLTPTSSGSNGRVSFQGSSEDGSISPEPLSESLMGPPPRPASSVTQSPAMTAQSKSADASGDAAATPKSILSMKGMQAPGSTASVGANALRELALDDLELPAAANPGAAKPSLAQLDTRMSASNVDESTPRLAARKTPKLGPSSTPTSARPNPLRPASASNSPLVGGMMPGTTPTAILREKTQIKGGRPMKKRGSLSTSGSTMLSPALRPRISPSIKPLLPEGTALHSPTHALLLASKSNYQNLLEGNHLPGVNYPDSLSTGLTSKRTSHKVAEQGRRNRINEALKEMQSLLPKSAMSKQSKDTSAMDSSSPGADDGAEGDTKDGKSDAAKSNSSKAATVESANEYIRKLQKENADLQKEFADMRRRLESDNEISVSKPDVETAPASLETKPSAEQESASAIAQAITEAVSEK